MNLCVPLCIRVCVACTKHRKIEKSTPPKKKWYTPPNRVMSVVSPWIVTLVGSVAVQSRPGGRRCWMLYGCNGRESRALNSRKTTGQGKNPRLSEHRVKCNALNVSPDLDTGPNQTYRRHPLPGRVMAKGRNQFAGHRRTKCYLLNHLLIRITPEGKNSGRQGGSDTRT
jgi:hypothetical protein